jgi:sec-independent protein translocase protein TatA
MGSMSIWHWIIVGGVALVLFGGKGKISDLMGDFAKGIKSFKKGMSEDDTPPATDVSHPAEPPRNIPHAAATSAEKTPDAHKV